LPVAREPRSARAETGRLIVADGTRGDPAAEEVVSVFDDDGEAIILVPRRARFDAAVRRHRHAALLMDTDPEFGVGLTLLGRLGAAPSDPSRCGRVGCAPATRDQAAVAFIVDRVLVSCPYEEVSVMIRTRRPIPLDVYALAEPDRMPVALSRMIPHLNRDHSQDVRALAALSAGLPVRDVIGAELNHLCPLGFGLRWVGAEGGDEVRYRFDEPACDPVEI